MITKHRNLTAKETCKEQKGTAKYGNLICIKSGKVWKVAAKCKKLQIAESVAETGSYKRAQSTESYGKLLKDTAL